MTISVPWQPELDALILCASRQRPHGDKGLALHGGRPLALHARERLQRQSCLPDTVFASANDHHDSYRRLGFEPVADNFADWPGPLAALEAALSASDADCLLVVPCDLPELPFDAAAKLWRPLALSDAPYAYAVCDGIEPSGVCLLTHRVLPQLRRRLAAPRIDLVDWLREPGGVAVTFADGAAFCPVAA
ncbi:NTP transferase domain-containing protein [Chitinimonas koreensis]|uniref:NTP transferase domain-containing protein n=1 Tax=Chitinimonas koreensis TaxID=356302 RepID=UPI0004208590|nr:NTP transferase domain-containing protein [Chitinimonas koreensis]QNM97763.1 NTP transferase domain-containing protein [Chitinimonas koreensis]